MCAQVIAEEYVRELRSVHTRPKRVRKEVWNSILLTDTKCAVYKLSGTTYIDLPEFPATGFCSFFISLLSTLCITLSSDPRRIFQISTEYHRELRSAQIYVSLSTNMATRLFRSSSYTYPKLNILLREENHQKTSDPLEGEERLMSDFYRLKPPRCFILCHVEKDSASSCGFFLLEDLPFVPLTCWC